MSSPNNSTYANAVKSSTPKSLKKISISRTTPGPKSTPEPISVSKNQLKRKRDLISEDSGEAPPCARQAKLQPAERVFSKVCSETAKAVSKSVTAAPKEAAPVILYIKPGFESRSVQTDGSDIHLSKYAAFYQDLYQEQVADEKAKNNKLSDKFFAQVQKNQILDSTISEIKVRAEKSIARGSHTSIHIEVEEKERTRKSKSKKKPYQPSDILAPAFNLQTQTFIQLNCEITKARCFSDSLLDIVSLCDDTVNKLTQRNVKNALDFKKNSTSIRSDYVYNKSLNKVVKIDPINLNSSSSNRVRTRSSTRTPKTPAPKSAAPSKLLGVNLKSTKSNKKSSQNKVQLDVEVVDQWNEFRKIQSSSPKVAETTFPDPLIEISIASQESVPAETDFNLSEIVGKIKVEEARLRNIEKSKKFVESESNPVNFSLCNISQESDVEWFNRPENRHLDRRAYQYSDDIVCPPKDTSLSNLSDSFILKSEDEDSLTDEKIRIWTRKIKREPKDDADHGL